MGRNEFDADAPGPAANVPLVHSGIPLGGFLLGVSSLFLLLGSQIERTGVSAQGDPGPRLFPLILSSLLLLVGLGFLLRSWFPSAAVRQWWRRAAGIQAAESGTARFEAARFEAAGFVTAERWNPLLLILGLAIYLPLLPLLGFTAATIVFCTLMLVRLGARRRNALLAAGGLVLLVKALFTRLFEVQLPEGFWTSLF